MSESLCVNRLIAVLAASTVLAAPVMAQHHHDHHMHHGHHAMPDAQGSPKPVESLHSSHNHQHNLGPAGSTYDLRWLDAMVQHHTGALRMSEEVFNIGSPGIGALANEIWFEQAKEIKAMLQWRKAWYPEAPTYPIAWKAGEDPNSIDALGRMTPEQIQDMQMTGSKPTPDTRVVWCLEGMLMHHGGALHMAHDALKKSKNTDIKRLSQQIILSQRHEINRLRQMLEHEGLSKPEYRQFDHLFSLTPKS